MPGINNAEFIREIIQTQFESEAEFAQSKQNTERARVLTHLAQTAKDIDTDILDAYSELFESMQDSEVEQELLGDIGVFWFPKTASEFVQGFIAKSSGTA